MPTAAPSPSTTEMCVVPVGLLPAPATPYASASADASARASSTEPGGASSGSSAASPVCTIAPPREGAGVVSTGVPSNEPESG